MNRIYLDTSVFGGYFDPEFELWTTILFDKIIKGEYKVIYSKLIDIELTGAPQKVKDLVNSLPISQLELTEISDEAILLA